MKIYFKSVKEPQVLTDLITFVLNHGLNIERAVLLWEEVRESMDWDEESTPLDQVSHMVDVMIDDDYGRHGVNHLTLQHAMGTLQHMAVRAHLADLTGCAKDQSAG